MIGEPLKPHVLALRLIPDVAAPLAAALGLDAGQRCLGLVTADCDDALYAALDQGTKAAAVTVVYAKSFYAGARHASGPLSGEIIGMLAAADLETLIAGVTATVRYLRAESWFYAADDANTLAFFPHVVASTGSYLSGIAGCRPGEPLAYLIAPPLEAMIGLDAALKAAEVRLAKFYGPPTETNFAGGLLTGDLPACRAAAQAFRDAVLDVARRPRHLDFRGDLEPALGAAPARAGDGLGDGSGHWDEGPYRLWGSGLVLAEKPENYTHLRDNTSLVRKDHPILPLRGKLDLLEAEVLVAQAVARQAGREPLVAELGEVLDFLRRLLAAEVVGRPCPTLEVGGFSGDELRRISHDTLHQLGIGFVLPAASQGPVVVVLNRLRALSRELELVAGEALARADHVDDPFRAAAAHQLNRLSSALHVLVCRELAQGEGTT